MTSPIHHEVIIQFYSKWDIERNYDFVEVLGSPDGGSSWISLCGKYTKPNATSATTSHDNKSGTYANYQANSSGQIYDGDRMDNWVMEEIVIDNTYASLLSSNNVKIRFNFRTDALNVNENYTTTNDGFFIDDFKIISVQIPCDETNPPSGLTISSITTVSANITWNAIPSATYDLRFREIGAPTWTEVTDIATNNYNIAGLTSSTNYEVQVLTRCISATSIYSSSQSFSTLAPVPCTGNTVNSYPYNENFNSGAGLWTQDSDDINSGTDQGNWTLDSGGTPTTTSGPSDDFTGGGNYFYTEASVSNDPGPNKTVNLISPCFDLTGFENASFSFYYHMYGVDMGNLNLDISLDNGTNWNNLYSLIGPQQNANSDAWIQQIVDLSIYDGQTIKLRFSGTTGTNFASDMAIDQLNLSADVIAVSDPPIAVCQNITVQLDDAGNATIVAIDVDGGSSDDVAIQIIVLTSMLLTVPT